jgi:hypothetical protein
MKLSHSLLLVIALALIGIVLLYPEVSFGLNDVMFSIEGDGLKNYFNFMYHIRHDSSYLVFEGMNYPYGETLLMVDLHPALSSALKFISNNVVDISDYSVGILNGLMLASIVFTSAFLYLILDELRIPRKLSIAGALAISFFSSQFLLWEFGHYALSYSCFFPITWYLIIRSRRSDKHLMYSLIILLNCLLWFYSHGYLGLIAVGFNAGILFLSFIAEKERRKRVLLQMVFQVVLPLIIVYSVLQLTDHREGRLEMPFQTDYKASGQTVFFPNYSFTKPFYELIFDLGPQAQLSWSKVGTYVGLPVNLILLGYLLYTLSNVLRRRWSQIGEPFSKSEWITIMSSIFLLLFSMAIPLSYLPDAWLPNMLKQFIGLGRFGWPFFYVMTVFSIVFLFRMFPKKLAFVLILLMSTFCLAESAGYHIHLKKSISKHSNILKDFEQSETFAELSASIDFDEYQAIVPLPFYHKYITPTQLTGSLESETLSMGLSYATGLPLMSAILSRPSVLESKRIFQLFSPWYYEKSLQNDLSNRPMLVVHTKEDLTELERDFLEKGKVIFENRDVVALRMSVSKIYEGETDEIDAFLESKDQFIFDNESGYFLRDSFPFVSESFDQMSSPLAKRGSGALTLDRHNLQSIYHSDGGDFHPGLEYTFSFWYYNDIYDQSFTGVVAYVKDSTGSVYSSIYLNDPIKTALYEGNWAYNEFNFKVNRNSDQVELAISAIDIFADSLYVDEILIYPVGEMLYKPIYTDDGSLDAVIRNNEMISIP